MKSLIKLFPLLAFIAITTTSCVSNYVTSNNDYKYPTTKELLAHRSTSKPETASDLYSYTKASIKESLALLGSSENEASSLLDEAKTYLGTPYRYGGTTRNGIDCSSFVQHSFAALDISLPRTSILQSQEGTYIPKEDLRKGDLIFFAQSSRSRISHVGIVENVDAETGEIFFIHASSSKGVTISSLEGDYWKRRYRTAKRIINLDNSTMANLQKIKEQTQNEEASIVKVSF